MLPKYAYLKLPDGIFIIQLSRPFYIGKISMYKEGQEFENYTAKLKKFTWVALDGYNIVVQIYANLSGDSEGTEKTKFILNEIMQFFVETRVNDNPKFYGKFKK